MNNISGKTKLFGLIGDPVSHSLSPKMHNFAFNQLELDYIYLAFNVKAGKADDALKAMKALDIKGYNVTMPLKTEVVPYLDRLTAEAKIIGAVNTIVNHNGELVGHNTDGSGMVHAIKSSGTELFRKNVVIFGSGGAGTSVLASVGLEQPFSVTICVNSTSNTEKADKVTAALLEEHPEVLIQKVVYNTPEFNQAVKNAHIIINTTPVGMSPNETDSPLEDTSLLNPSQLVADAVYKPIETRLLQQAKAIGCKTVNGVGMLVWQGAEAFRLFTGEEMPIKSVKEYLFKGD